MKKGKEQFECTACGKRAMLDRTKRHWCDCNPAAPFYMYSVKQLESTRQLVAGFMEGLAYGRK